MFLMPCLGACLARADCSLTNIGVTPLPELGLAAYEGFSGGLYPNGGNNRPPAHLAAGINIATNQIRPLDAAGNVDTNSGKIVLLSSGMSNVTQEWATKGTNNFLLLANADPGKNPQVIIVDGAIGGQDASKWTNINSTNWQTVITQRLPGAGVTTNQVQAIWLKQAIANETGPLTNHARLLESYLEQIARNMRLLFPNLKLVYVSSRTRAYVYGSGLNPEPYAFETGFAVKWLIETQINGGPGLNFNPSNGPVVAPYLSWAPYLWADGTVPRSDGFTWLCSDLESDFTHPSATGGVPKVAHELLAYFKTDPTAAPWFLRRRVPGLPDCTASADTTNGLAPLAVHFSANITGSVAQVVWTFDDGEFSYAQNPAKLFPTPGAYTARVTVTATNGNTATSSVVVIVNTTFQAWRLANFSASQLTNAAISGPAATPSGGNLPNLLEYALGINPQAANTSLPATGIADGIFTLSFPHYKAATDVSLSAEVSTNLMDWVAVVPTQVIDNGPVETWVVQDTLAGKLARFFRLRATP